MANDDSRPDDHGDGEQDSNINVANTPDLPDEEPSQQAPSEAMDNNDTSDDDTSNNDTSNNDTSNNDTSNNDTSNNDTSNNEIDPDVAEALDNVDNSFRDFVREAQTNTGEPGVNKGGTGTGTSTSNADPLPCMICLAKFVSDDNIPLSRPICTESPRRHLIRPSAHNQCVECYGVVRDPVTGRRGRSVPYERALPKYHDAVKTFIEKVVEVKARPAEAQAAQQE